MVIFHVLNINKITGLRGYLPICKNSISKNDQTNDKVNGSGRFFVFNIELYPFFHLTTIEREIHNKDLVDPFFNETDSVLLYSISTSLCRVPCRVVVDSQTVVGR